jgi:hypothetical protein
MPLFLVIARKIALVAELAGFLLMFGLKDLLTACIQMIKFGELI